MQLGSHNSMSYSKARKWWMRPFQFMARCQSVSIQRQYEEFGARLFDLRIKFNKKGEVFFAHGIMEYSESIDDALKFLDSVGAETRILLENKAGEFENSFIIWCQKVRKQYPNIKLFGGRNKFTWKEIYKFSYKGPSFLDKYSSYNVEEKGKPITGTYLDDWFPFLYAWKNNRNNIKKGTNRDYLMIDFVNIQ